MTVPQDRLEAFYGKPIIPAYRETVELEADEILRDADKEDVAFLVAGDPLRWVGSSEHRARLRRSWRPLHLTAPSDGPFGSQEQRYDPY